MSQIQQNFHLGQVALYHDLKKLCQTPAFGLTHLLIDSLGSLIPFVYTDCSSKPVNMTANTVQVK